MEVLRGQIWLAKLDPTIGHEIKKTRPSLIIQNDIGNHFSQLTIIAPITSQGLQKIYGFEVLLSKSSELKKPSKIILDQIRCIDKNRLIKLIGKIDLETQKQVDIAIKISLGIIKSE